MTKTKKLEADEEQKKRAGELKALASMAPTKTTDDYRLAGELLVRQIKPFLSEVEDKWTPEQKLARKRVNELSAGRSDEEAQALEAEKIIKKKLVEFQADFALDKVVREAGARREAVEKEMASRDALASALRAEGRDDEAETVLSGPIMTHVQIDDDLPKVEGLSTRMLWSFLVENPDAIPREYLTPDLKKIGKLVDALREKTEIPGVIPFQVPVIAASKG